MHVLMRRYHLRVSEPVMQVLMRRYHLRVGIPMVE